jgi:hypothetical protein
MPFSNLVDFIVTDGATLAEFVQVPPQPLLPGYVGSNAAFMPLPQYVSDAYEGILDLTKVFTGNSPVVRIGYLFGGIRSGGPTSGTTPEGHVNTYANAVLYGVDLSVEVSKVKAAPTT